MGAVPIGKRSRISSLLLRDPQTRTKSIPTTPCHAYATVAIISDHHHSPNFPNPPKAFSSAPQTTQSQPRSPTNQMPQRASKEAQRLPASRPVPCRPAPGTPGQNSSTNARFRRTATGTDAGAATNGRWLGKRMRRHAGLNLLLLRIHADASDAQRHRSMQS